MTDILRKNETDLKQKDLLDIVLRNAKKLKQLTEDVLDVTRIESNSLQLNKVEFNLNELAMHLVQDYKNQIARDNGIKLVYDDKDEGHAKDNAKIIVRADKHRINQVLSNLVSNSTKFTNEGGTISIKIETSNNNDNNAITVSVRDSGTGIDPEIMPRLFTKFATKSGTGTGLGLFISKKYCRSPRG